MYNAFPYNAVQYNFYLFVRTVVGISPGIGISLMQQSLVAVLTQASDRAVLTQENTLTVLK